MRVASRTVGDFVHPTSSRHPPRNPRGKLWAGGDLQDSFRYLLPNTAPIVCLK